MQKRANRVLLNTGHGVNDVYWYILPAILPIIVKQFDLKYGTAGGILTAYLGSAAIFSFLLGKLSDNISRQRVLGAGFLIASASLIIAGFMGRIGPFITFLLIASIGVSSYHPAAYALITETTEVRQGNVYAIFELSGAAGGLAMFLLYGLLLRKLDYHFVIIITSIPGLILGFIYLCYAKQYSSKALLKNSFNETTHSNEIPIHLFILFLIVITFRSLGVATVISFTPTYLIMEIGLNKSLASFATGIYFLGEVTLIPVISRLIDRWGPYSVMLAVTGMICPLIFLVSTSHQVWMLPLYFFFIGGFYASSWPAQDMIIAQMSRKIGRGEAFGYAMAVVSVTSSLGPLFFGMAADRIGLRLSIMASSASLLISFLVLFVLTRLLALRKRA
ncbi:MAG: MFS transporter [Spirochaetota bacterium]|nr:MAG: MFS transporter [Spirochaetota bacterium]